MSKTAALQEMAHMLDDTCVVQITRVSAELRRLSAQVEALEANAARYRWLRSDDIEVPHDQREIYVVMDPLPNREDQRREVLTESALDAAIDAAIAKEQT